MNIIPINELSSLNHKDAISGIEGVLTAVYEHKAGMGEKGPWSFQNAVLQNGTGSIDLVFSGRDEIPSLMKGSHVKITAYMGKHGMSGLYIDDNSYNNKTTRRVKVTKTADIEEILTSKSETTSPVAEPMDVMTEIDTKIRQMTKAYELIELATPYTTTDKSDYDYVNSKRFQMWKALGYLIKEIPVNE